MELTMIGRQKYTQRNH